MEKEGVSASDSSSVHVALFNLILYAELLEALTISLILSMSVATLKKLEIEKKSLPNPSEITVFAYGLKRNFIKALLNRKKGNLLKNKHFFFPNVTWGPFWPGWVITAGPSSSEKSDRIFGFYHARPRGA